MDSQEVPDQAEHREEASPSVPVREEEPPQIIISLSNGRRLEVRETIPPRTLKQLLSVLEVS
jgi:transposase